MNTAISNQQSESTPAQITAVCCETAQLAQNSLARLNADATLSYIAKPADSRCKWWCKMFPAAFAAGLDLSDVASIHGIAFVRKNADLELSEGDFVLDSEENSHRKARGYRVTIAQVVRSADGVLAFVGPDGAAGFSSADMETKQAVKAKASKAQWAELAKGSGDVAACLRWAKARAMGVV